MDPALSSYEVGRRTLLLDVDRVARHTKALKRGIGFARIHPAVKATRTLGIIERQAKEGAARRCIAC